MFSASNFIEKLTTISKVVWDNSWNLHYTKSYEDKFSFI